MRRFLVLFVVGFVLGTVVAGSAAAVYVVWRFAPRAHHVAPRGGPDVGPRPLPPAPEGPLAGLVVYLSAGHGVLLQRQHHDGDPIAWGTQRGTTHGVIEDYWTQGFVTDWLAPSLEDAGATVIALRERDKSPVAYVVDETDPTFAAYGVSEYVDEPLAQGGHAWRLDPGGSADWKVTAPDDGDWYLYARWVEADDQDQQAIYTVTAGDEVREIVVDQTEHGGHWYPLGNFCLRGGTEVEVTLTGSGFDPLSADAIRIGGGTHKELLPWNFAVVSKPNWEVAFPHQLELLGGPPWIEDYECGNPVSDMRLRPHWCNWASPVDEDAMYLSIHTNATPFGRAKGLTSFYGVESTPPTPPDPESVRLAELLEKGVYGSVHAHDPGYETRGVKPGDYSEISPLHNTLPSALLEMAFHTDADDARRLLTSQFKRDAAQGITDAIAQWYHSRPTDRKRRTEADRARGSAWDLNE
jgi:hypothetical protein